MAEYDGIPEHSSLWPVNGAGHNEITDPITVGGSPGEETLEPLSDTSQVGIPEDRGADVGEAPVDHTPVADNAREQQHSASDVERIVAEVRDLDPELLENPQARQLVELSAEFGAEVTDRFGTPDAPKWASGTYETEVVMSYHNGGVDGHTSVGTQGMGVPRNVLAIARATNAAASERAGEPVEVFDAVDRATDFYAAYGHDGEQLCGRALLPEGQATPQEAQGDADAPQPESMRRGDERLSAEAVRDRHLEAGGDPQIAQQAYDSVMATAFNPKTGAQNVDYTAWHANPDDPAALRAVLGQELTAAADLLGTTSRRGPLGALEYSLESLCLIQKGQIMQERLRAHNMEPTDITDLDQLLDFVGQDEVLRTQFADTVEGQSRFFANLTFSDEAIRAACGKGIDELFPGRLGNAGMLAWYTGALRDGTSPRAIWELARTFAGY